jgi:hypothetical protein
MDRFYVRSIVVDAVIENNIQNFDFEITSNEKLYRLDLKMLDQLPGSYCSLILSDMTTGNPIQIIEIEGSKMDIDRNLIARYNHDNHMLELYEKRKQSGCISILISINKQDVYSSLNGYFMYPFAQKEIVPTDDTIEVLERISTQIKKFRVTVSFDENRGCRLYASIKGF